MGPQVLFKTRTFYVKASCHTYVVCSWELGREFHGWFGQYLTGRRQQQNQSWRTAHIDAGCMRAPNFTCHPGGTCFVPVLKFGFWEFRRWDTRTKNRHERVETTGMD